MKKIKDTKDVTIFPDQRGADSPDHGRRAGNRGMGIHASELDYLQADNEMRTFAAMTGGRAYFPRFQAEYAGRFPGHFQRHTQSIFALVSPHQHQARRHLPQVEGASGSARRRPDQSERPERQRTEDRSRLPRWLHRQAYGGLRTGNDADLPTDELRGSVDHQGRVTVRARRFSGCERWRVKSLHAKTNGEKVVNSLSNFRSKRFRNRNCSNLSRLAERKVLRSFHS